jgi:phosphoribosylaminoimidazolecarboxamide formyltransferase/IMP cyclohydrolase
VAVICQTAQYDQLLEAVKAGGFTEQERRTLALEVFRTTAEYDLAIATWLDNSNSNELPEWFGRIWHRENSLRYGENPHQAAAIYSGGPAGIVGAQQLHGKEMSFNNYTDAEAAWRSVLDHRDPAVAIMKHANPCGIAVCELGVAVAYKHAHECDPVSAFGGVVAANRTVDLAMAEPLSKIFTEVIIAPDYEQDALELLMKKPSIRILKCDVTEIAQFELRPVSGGVLLQETDVIDADGDSPANWKQVSGDPVDVQTMKDLEFAWRSVRSVKSNAILLAKGTASVGIGMGQVNRVDSARLAVARAGDRVKGSVAASDAFFPFADGLQILIDAGVTAVIQPGGSVRDEEVVAAAQKGGIAMFFTGTRHFSHA